MRAVRLFVYVRRKKRTKRALASGDICKSIRQFSRNGIENLSNDNSITVSSTWELTLVSMRYSRGDGVDTSLSRITVPMCYSRLSTLVLLSCVILYYVVRSCASWDDNNKDNVCTPTKPAGLKCPPPSKTTSLITRFEAHSTRLARVLEGLREVFGLQAWDPETVSFYIGWNKSKAEELILPPRSEEFENTAEERSFTSQRRAGLTRPGAGATRRERHRDRR